MKWRKVWTSSIAAIAMLVLILDAKTAFRGAADGISLCLNTVIPSLFPFLFLSVILNGALLGTQLPILAPLGRVLGVPKGAEQLLLVGVLGGYPVGAQCISDAYRNHRLSKQDAKRMLGFCSNAGPAFIFGMGSSIFHQGKILWGLWAIHILSAIFVGLVLPGKSNVHTHPHTETQSSLSRVLDRSVRTMAKVCGWIILFRVLIAFLDRWLLWAAQPELQVLLSGVLELSNGCCMLPSVSSQATKFILCSALLAFGGLCVMMQTFSVTSNTGMGLYFPGKVMQCGISVFLSGLLKPVLFPSTELGISWLIGLAVFLFTASIVMLRMKNKKRVEILC